MVEEAVLVRDVLSALGWLGSWEIDYAAERVCYAGQLRTVYGLPSSDAHESVPFSCTDHIFYKDDLEAVKHFRKTPACVVSGLRTVRFRVVDADRRFRWIESRGHVAVDRYGRLTHGRGVMFDVTAQCEAPEQRDLAAPALADLDGLVAKLIQACRSARTIGLPGIEQELRLTLTKVVRLLSTTVRTSSMH